MIELIREGASLALAWCIGLTITYGIVESTFPPLMAFRIALSSEGDAGWWVERLLYCPYCMGFWAHGVVGTFSHDGAFWGFVRGACLGTASLLLARAAWGSNLVEASRYELEAEAREELRARDAHGGG